MSRTTLVANLGTTSEPIIQALEAAAREGPVTMFLVYGRAISEQETPPLHLANEVCERAKQVGVRCRPSELSTPEDFEGSFEFYKRLIDDVSRDMPERVIVDITGGTKVMAAALTHAALGQEWGAEVIFEYVGGLRNGTGRVSVMELRRDERSITQEHMADVLDSIRHQEFARAAFLAATLPQSGKAGFLRRAAELFLGWDNFRYAETERAMLEMGAQAQVMDDRQLRRIADTVLRLRRVAPRVKLAIGTLKQAKDEDSVSLVSAALEGWVIILGDTIANARRRSQSDPVDCILRCYRAIEVATQIVVFKLGINPWRPDWGKLGNAALVNYLSKIRNQEPPGKVSLDNGIKLIEVLISPLPEEVGRDIRDIMTARNFCYLEHGYDGVSKETALSLMAKAEKAAVALLSKTDIKHNLLDIAKQLRIEA